MNSIYYDALKLNQKPVNEKRISINTAVARFETFFIPVISPSDIIPLFISPSKAPYEVLKLYKPRACKRWFTVSG